MSTKTPNIIKSTANSAAPQLSAIPCVIIVGGTSGVGLGLAIKHLDLGWQVVIVGSSVDKIQKINHSYPDIINLQCDLSQTTQRQQLLHYLTTLTDDTANNLNLVRVIYAAGWYLNERTTTLNQADSSQMLAINLQAFNDIFAWASEQLKQHSDVNNPSSQYGSHKRLNEEISANTASCNTKPVLVCLASIAGLMDYPYASLYAKCKRSMIVTTKTYRMALAPHNIQVNCIASGYVDTQTLRDLNQGNADHKPFIIDEQTAVNNIMQAINNDVELAIFPWQMRYLTRAINKLPKPLVNFAMRRKLDKKS